MLLERLGSISGCRTAPFQRISLGHVLLREIKGNKKKLGLERARGYSNRYNFFCNRLVGLEIHGRMPKMSSELLLTAEIQHFQSEFGFLASLGSSRQLLQLLFLDRKIIKKSKCRPFPKTFPIRSTMSKRFRNASETSRNATFIPQSPL